MSNLNPYAPPFGLPPIHLHTSGESAAFRDGNTLLVAASGTDLPDRCVVCNTPATTRVHKTLHWHPPGLYLVIFAGLLVYAIVALIVRKPARISYGLCAQHDTRRKAGLALSIGGLVGFFVLLVFVVSTNGSPSLLVVSLLSMLASPIVGGRLARVVSPSRIDERFAWLKVGQPFLESMPVFQGFAPGIHGYGAMSAQQSAGFNVPFGGPTARTIHRPSLVQATAPVYNEPQTPEALAEQEARWGPKL